MKILNLILSFILFVLVGINFVVSNHVNNKTKLVESRLDILNDYPIKGTFAMKVNKEATLEDTFILLGFAEFESDTEPLNSFDRKYVPIFANAQELQVSVMLQEAQMNEAEVEILNQIIQEEEGVTSSDTGSTPSTN